MRTSAAVTLASVVLVSGAPVASAKPREADEVFLPAGNVVASIGAKGMDCTYTDPPSAASRYLAPALGVPATGDVVVTVSAGLPSAPPSLLTVSAKTGKAALVGTVAAPGFATSATLVCTLLTSANGATAAIEVIAPTGQRTWYAATLATKTITPITVPAGVQLTSSAAVSQTGDRVFIASEPCATCTTGYTVHSFDTTTGALIATFPITIPADQITAARASGRTGISLGATGSRAIVAVDATDALHLWSLDDRTLTPATQSALPPSTAGPARVSSCRGPAGMQVRGGRLLAATPIALDYSALPEVASSPSRPAGETVRVLDATTLAPALAFDAYRGPYVAATEENSLCPWFGPYDLILDASIAYSPTTGQSVGWSYSGQYEAGRVQGTDRVWDTRTGDPMVGFSRWDDLYRYPYTQNFAPTLARVSPTDVTSSPAWQHLSSTVEGFIDDDFTLVRYEIGDEWVYVTADIARRDSTYRFVKKYDDEKVAGRTVVYAAPKVWCSRTTTKALPDSIKADLKARWSCTRNSAGWKDAQKRAEGATAGQVDSIEGTLTQWGSGSGVLLYGSTLTDAQADRIGWLAGFQAKSSSASIVCDSGTAPRECDAETYIGSGFSGGNDTLSIAAGAASLPRLTANGRLVRR